MSYPVVDSGDNWWETPPTFPSPPWNPTPLPQPYPQAPSLPHTYPVYTDQPVKCPQCGTWWRGTEHRCNLSYGVGTTTNTFTVSTSLGGRSAADVARQVNAELAKMQSPKKKRKGKKVDKKQPPDIVFK